MTVSFNHGDGYPFDDPGGTMSHSFPPTDGRLHFDENETIWVVIVRFPTISLGETKVLHQDDNDIQGPELPLAFTRFSRWPVKRDLPQQISTCLCFFFFSITMDVLVNLLASRLIPEPATIV